MSMLRGFAAAVSPLGRLPPSSWGTERFYLAWGDVDEGGGPHCFLLVLLVSRPNRGSEEEEGLGSLAEAFLSVACVQTDLHSGPAVSPQLLHHCLKLLPPAIRGQGQVLHVEDVGLHLMEGNRADLIDVEGGDLMPAPFVFDFRGKHFFSKATHCVINF